MGAQEYSMLIAFKFYTALKKFNSETDVNFNIAMVKWNIEEELGEIDFD